LLVVGGHDIIIADLLHAHFRLCTFMPGMKIAARIGFKTGNGASGMTEPDDVHSQSARDLGEIPLTEGIHEIADDAVFELFSRPPRGVARGGILQLRAGRRRG